MMQAKKHWTHQRITALINLPLMLWLACSVVHHAGASHAALVIWLSNPINASLLGLAILSVSYHAFLGTENVVEDYVQCPVKKKAAKIALAAAFFAVWLVSFLSLIKICIAG